MKRDISQNAVKALLNFAARYLLVVTSETLSKWDHGTCFAVRYKKRKYIVTAGHVLEDTSRYGRPIHNDELIFHWGCQTALEFIDMKDFSRKVSSGNASYTKPKPLPLTKRIITKKSLDLGLMELKDVEIADLEFYDLEKSGFGTPIVGREVVFLGCPGQISIQVQEKTTGKKGAALIHASEVSKVVNSQRYSLSSTFSDKIHFLLDYEHDPEEEFKSAEGMSGTAIWEVPLSRNPEEIWSPTNSRPIGILTGQYRKNQLLKATKIEELIKVLMTL